MEIFHILLVGFAAPIFSRLILYIRDRCNYKVTFIVASTREFSVLLSSGISAESIYCLSEDEVREPNMCDVTYLSSLERDDVPSIHNMIMSDSIVNRLSYSEGIAYAVNLARKFESLYKEIKPTVVIGGHDGVHSGIGFAVAKALSIPWFALNFSTVPRGYAAFSTGIIPNENVCLRNQPDEDLHELAETSLRDFENRHINAPAYVSAYNFRIVINRLYDHILEACRVFKATCFGGLNKYTEHDFRFISKQYLRKRKNMLRLPREWFLTEPPSVPYVFFGLHMQPESSIDVYAPFYSNQIDIIEKISRSIPPNYQFLVKLHISDADNYSRKQLLSLLRLPGVKIVAPNVLSREFIEKASAVVTIAGTMGLEGALLGKPVLVFARTAYEHFPSVTRIVDINNLPNLMRLKLKEERPIRDSIIDAYKKYLNPYFRATHNDWKRPNLSRGEEDGFVELFRSLERYMLANLVL